MIDCTSGDPDASVQIAQRLNTVGADFIDAPISGGVTGAEKGTLTVMAGGKTRILEEIRPLLSTFSSNIVHVGEPVGSGHALKGINNLMNVAHLLIAAEGLIALANRGIDPDVALAAINGSSGRSLATTARFPDHVVTRKFAHGFTMELMEKDADIGVSVLGSSFPSAAILPLAATIFHRAGAYVGGQADYTESVKYLEHEGGVVLSSSGRKD